MKYPGLYAFANMIAKALKNISEDIFERKNILHNIKQIFLKILFGHFPPISCSILFMRCREQSINVSISETYFVTYVMSRQCQCLPYGLGNQGSILVFINPFNKPLFESLIYARYYSEATESLLPSR